MAKCECCGKGVTFGIKVSHSHRRSNRTWKPNVRRVKAVVEGSPKYIYACSRCLRAGKADELALGLNRANRDFDGSSGLLQNCIRPQLNCLVHRHAFYLGQLRNRRIKQPAPLLGGDLFRG